MTRKFLFAFLALFPVSASAIDLPSIGFLFSDNDSSILYMQCTGEKPYEKFECDFTQERVSKDSLSSAEMETYLQKLKSEDSEKWKLDFQGKCKQIESDLKKNSTSDPLRKLRFEHESNLLKEGKKGCECLRKTNSIDCVTTTFREVNKLESNRCKVTVNTFKIEFKSISKNKWMNTPEPKGVCNTVNEITLEFNENKKWSFVQTRLSLDKKVGFCDRLDVNKPQYYSSVGTGTYKLNCEIISLEGIGM